MKKIFIVYLVGCFMLSGCSLAAPEYTAEEGPQYTAEAAPEYITDEIEQQPNVEQELPTQNNTEQYNAIVENGFMSVKDHPRSTFSADVDTASYTNIRRMIMQEELPVKDAVRIEEMINYFHYDYVEPTGDAPFSVQTEIASCPWNEDTQLMLIGLSGEEMDTDNLPPSNLVFLIDVSGSMGDDNKMPLVQESFSMLIENLGDRDKISIVTYAGDDQIILEGSNNKQEIRDAINNLTSGGSTHGSKGIITAYELAQEYYMEGGNNRVILATDGDLNVGLTSESELKELIEEKRETGVYLSTLGFGSGNYKDNKMETLSQNGNGNYYYIDSKMEARKVLVEEMGGTLHTIAKDVKLQVEFNGDWIKGYRLIGYENRVLATEDFNDDKKDAGEIGAGHQVTALYEIVPADSPMVLHGTDLKYEEETTTNSEQWLSISLRYKEPNGTASQLITHIVDETHETDELSDNLQLASCVAEFGMILRDSEYKGNSSYDEILGRLKTIDTLVDDSYKNEFYNLVKQASRMDR